MPLEKFSYTFTVPDDSIDMFGHVNNIEYVRWVQDAARVHSEHVGYTWQRYQEMGAAFLIRRHEIDYRRQSLAGEVLTFTTWIESYTRVSALRVTEIRNTVGDLVVAAKTTWVWVTLNTMRPARIPLDVRTVFGGE